MAAKSYLRRVSGRPTVTAAVVTSAGAANDGDIPALDAAGKLDISVFPAGIGQNTVAATASEAIGAGKFVNLWDNGGVLSARLADATAAGKEASGFVKAAVASSGAATVYLNGNTNDQMTGLTIGAHYSLSSVSPGGVVLSSAEASAAGNIGQRVGQALSATSIVVDLEESPTTY